MNARRVLLVDDEPHVLRVLKLMLEREAYAVSIARSGTEALAAVREQAPDVLVTDIQMPGMDGRQLCDALEREFPQRAFLVLVMTSMTDREHREWTARLTNLDFVEKPVSPRRLIERLGRHFAQQPAAEASHG
jgi:CheY-like chemotaxis protein